MNYRVSKEKIFCLRNWGICANSLNIRLTATFDDEFFGEEVELDLLSGNTTMDGLLIDIDPKADGVGVLCIGIDATDRKNTVSQFVLELETERGNIAGLALEYAFANPLDAYRKQITWEKSPLSSQKLIFTIENDEIFVKMTNSQTSQESQSLSLKKQPSPDEENAFFEDENTEKSISTETDDFENVRGDIEADLQILRYFNSSRAKEIAESFQRILSGLAEIPLEEVVSAVREQEKLLTDCIVRTQTDIQQYRKSIAEK